jgi:hypothetical protein
MVEEMSEMENIMGWILMVPLTIGLMWVGAQIDNDKEDK